MMANRYVSGLRMPARELRRHMTVAERRLWERLRRKQIANVQFYRQRPLGRFIVDFYAPAARLVVEVDGEHHCDEAQASRDRERSAWLDAEGFRVMRFTNDEVCAELDSVVESIETVIRSRRIPL